MKQKVRAGGELDIPTLEEIRALFYGGPIRDRIIATANIALNAVGNGTSANNVEDLYTVPQGMQCEIRRVALTVTGATGPMNGNIPLNVAGVGIAYLRSGTIMEWANPASAAGIPSVPGSQSWSKEQGPYLQNGQSFEVSCFGLAAAAGGFLTVTVEGIQTDPRPPREGRKQ